MTQCLAPLRRRRVTARLLQCQDKGGRVEEFLCLLLTRQHNKPYHLQDTEKMKSCMLLLSCVAPSAAFVATSGPARNTALAAQQSRTEFLRDVTATVGASVAASALGGLPAYADETLPSGVAIKVEKSGNGPKPDIGEMAAIRFRAFAGENKIDDLFDNPEPYYTRVGSGGLIKGVEEVLPKMVVGDRWVLTIPVSSGCQT